MRAPPEGGRSLAPGRVAGVLGGLFSRIAIAAFRRPVVTIAAVVLVTVVATVSARQLALFPDRPGDGHPLLGRALASSPSLALGLAAALVALLFRRPLAAWFVIAPLLVGLTLACGVAGALFGALDGRAASAGVMLAAVGIGQGIHLVARHEEEQRCAGEGDEGVIRRTFGEAGRVSLAAVLPAAAAFACLAGTDGRAFRALGVLSAAGLLLVLSSYAVLLPALLGLHARYSPRCVQPAARLAQPTPRLAQPTPRLAQPAAQRAQPAAQRAQPTPRLAQPAAQRAQPAAQRAQPAAQRASWRRQGWRGRSLPGVDLLQRWAPALLWGLATLGFAAMTQLRGTPLPWGRARAASSEPATLVDVLAAALRDAPCRFALTGALVLLALALVLGKLRLALLALAPAAVTLPVTVGLLPLLGLSLDGSTAVVLPILFGVALDHGARLVARVDAGDPLADVWQHTGWAVVSALLVGALGLGALALAAHPGLASLGKVALLGLFVSLVACVVLLPAALAVLPLAGGARRARRGSLARWVATVGGAGFSPGAPGTVGALVALPIAWIVKDAGWPAKAAVVTALVAVATLATHRYLREQGVEAKDPNEVVVDETVGCLVAVALVPHEPPWIVAAFVLFRALDIWKPGPVRMAERRLPGALGVVGDDVLAGALAGALLVSVRWIAS